MKPSIIRNDIEQFTITVRTLGNAFGKISLVWKDEKFQELRASVNQIVLLSKSVIEKGDNLDRRIDAFYKELERKV